MDISFSELLNEESKALNLKFPEDYTKRTSKATYQYLGGAMRPVGENDTWYESKSIVKNYRHIPVEMKHILNKDGSERLWKIISVGFNWDRIKLKGNQYPDASKVRESIDKYYKDFNEYMDNIEYNPTALENAINKLNIERREKNQPEISTENLFNDTPFEIANRWLTNNSFSLNEKRAILKQLMVKYKLDIYPAIIFWADVK